MAATDLQSGLTVPSHESEIRIGRGDRAPQKGVCITNQPGIELRRINTHAAIVFSHLSRNPPRMLIRDARMFSGRCCR